MTLVAFLSFIETAKTNERGKKFEVFWKENGIVEKLFMTLITEDPGYALTVPGTAPEEGLTHRSFAISRAPEEPFWNEVMPCGVRSAGGTGLGIPTGARDSAATDAALLLGGTGG